MTAVKLEEVIRCGVEKGLYEFHEKTGRKDLEKEFAILQMITINEVFDVRFKYRYYTAGEREAMNRAIMAGLKNFQKMTGNYSLDKEYKEAQIAGIQALIDKWAENYKEIDEEFRKTKES